MGVGGTTGGGFGGAEGTGGGTADGSTFGFTIVPAFEADEGWATGIATGAALAVGCAETEAAGSAVVTAATEGAAAVGVVEGDAMVDPLGAPDATALPPGPCARP